MLSPGIGAVSKELALFPDQLQADQKGQLQLNVWDSWASTPPTENRLGEEDCEKEGDYCKGGKDACETC